MQLTVALLSALVATTTAIDITSPPPPADVDVSKDWNVTWTHVNTDVASFCLYLTNHREYPPQKWYLRLASTDSDQATVAGKCYPELRSTPYRVWAAKCEDPNTIYAESDDFHAFQTPPCPV